jgi:hypothetical protein
MGTRHTNVTTQGQGREMDPTREMDRAAGQPDPGDREMAQGDQTKPAQPGGTRSLERDQQPLNQQR